MVKSIIRIFAVILNFGIIAFILCLVLREIFEFDNMNTYVFIILAMVTPLVNISALLGKLAFVKLMVALVVNTLVLAIFSFIILLVMVWPMGSKPSSAELVYVFSLYAALLFTELVHIIRIRKNRCSQKD